MTLTVRHNIWHGCWYITDGGTKLATCHNEIEVKKKLKELQKGESSEGRDEEDD
jgi:hypothetical protein